MTLAPNSQYQGPLTNLQERRRPPGTIMVRGGQVFSCLAAGTGAQLGTKRGGWNTIYASRAAFGKLTMSRRLFATHAILSVWLRKKIDRDHNRQQISSNIYQSEQKTFKMVRNANQRSYVLQFRSSNHQSLIGHMKIKCRRILKIFPWLIDALVWSWQIMNSSRRQCHLKLIFRSMYSLNLTNR